MVDRLPLELRVEDHFSDTFSKYAKELRAATQRTDDMRKHTRQFNSVLRETAPITSNLGSQFRNGFGSMDVRGASPPTCFNQACGAVHLSPQPLSPLMNIIRKRFITHH